jgi:drug/metabolite transporter (DMT)-like permease
MRWQIAAVIAGLLAALAVIVTQAPASLLDPVLSRFTQGRVRLAQAQGTLWQGSGRIVLADIREASSSPAPVSAASVPGVVIPGTFGWHISPVMLLIGALGLGPMGAAFFLWDMALKRGDTRHIGILSYLTPLASTAVLVLVGGRAFTWNIALAALLIVGAALLGTRGD